MNVPRRENPLNWIRPFRLPCVAVTSPTDDQPQPDGPIRLVVVFGGQSAEHDVSCTTATHVLAAANPDRYDIVPIGISRDGQWAIADDAAAILADGTRTLPPQLSPTGTPTELMPAFTAPFPGQQLVVLPLLHGPLGEDGTVQGMLELANVPYVGAGVLGSSLTMDKAKAKELLDAAGIPQTRWLAFNEYDWDKSTEPDRLNEIADKLGFPCFVKPANMGSSVGVSKVDDISELAEAIKLALRYDEWIVVEEGVDAREVELAVLGNHDLRVSVAGEILPADDFYSYEDKYLDGLSSNAIPAELPAGAEAEMQALAKQAYKLLRVEGMARADFLYEEGGRGPLLNELNTIPGFTPISMYPKLWEASGLNYSDLIDELVDLAIERHERRQSKRDTKR